MKIFITLVLVGLFAMSANAATVKQAWNLPADAVLSDGSINGRVTAPSECTLDNDNLFNCTNSLSPRFVVEDEE